MAVRAADRLACLVALTVPLALLVGAYVFQYGFGIAPCEMCWWQRYPHFAAVVFALLAMILPPRRTFLRLAALAIAVSGAIGGFHAGVEYGWWEGVTACAAPSMSAGTDPLTAILNAPLIRCDVAPWTLFGISLAGWNLLFSAAGALTIVWLLGRGGKASS